METVNQKYLKDENGEIFSPITSSRSVYLSETLSINSFIKHWEYKIPVAGSNWYRIFDITGLIPCEIMIKGYRISRSIIILYGRNIYS